MAPTGNLAFINFFIGDIQGGLGPFLATWLAETGDWSPARIGMVTTIVGFGGLLLSGPLGALVDRVHRPRLLVILACAMILAGTLLILPWTGFLPVTAAQALATVGGTLLLPAVAGLTLGIVGKDKFPRQQGHNQAWNHAGILVAAAIISFGTPFLGPSISMWVLAVMAVGAIAATALLPGDAWNRRRAVGWEEKEDEKEPDRSPLLAALKNPRLVTFAIALSLFQLGNGGMLTLLGQKLAAAEIDATAWTARYVMVAQGVMIPVAWLAGTYADKRGRRWLLIAACFILPIRALLTAFLNDPVWLISAEILDGIASGIMGVAVPVVVADLTWGSGRTQTALGSVNAIQGVGGAISAGFGGLIQGWLGWKAAFLALGLSGVLALVMVIYINATTEENPRAERTSKFVHGARERISGLGHDAIMRGRTLLRFRRRPS